MEKQDLKNLLENIYHLLAEAPPNDGTGPEGFGGPPIEIQPFPWQEPVYPYYGPGPTPPSGYDPGYGSGGYHPDNPSLRDRNFRPEVPPLPHGPNWRPPYPPCPRQGPCGFRWVGNATPGVWWWSGGERGRWILQGRVEEGHWEYSPGAIDPSPYGNAVLRFLWPYGYEDPATRQD